MASRRNRYASAEAFLGRDAASQAVCVVLDIHLDGMSGIELRRRLNESGSRLSVIFMTAIDDDAHEKEAIQAGCIAYLHKPFPAELLIGAIKNGLGRSAGGRLIGGVAEQ